MKINNNAAAAFLLCSIGLAQAQEKRFSNRKKAGRSSDGWHQNCSQIEYFYSSSH